MMNGRMWDRDGETLGPKAHVPSGIIVRDSMHPEYGTKVTRQANVRTP